MNHSLKEGWSTGLKLFWLVFGGIICLLWGSALVVRMTPQDHVLHDFVQEWASARNSMAGEPVYLDLSESIPKHLGGAYEGIVAVNAHPPTSVLLVLPFAWLDYQDAYLAWNLISLGALAASLWLLMCPSGLAFSAWTLLPVLTLLLTSNSLAQQVNQGQLNLILLLLIVGAWAALRADRLVLSGSLIGAATAIKLFPGFLLLYFVVKRQWAAVLAALVSMLTLTGLTGAILGWDCYQEYVQQVIPRVGQFRDFWPNASLTGFWSKLLDGSSGHVIPLWKNPELARAASLLSVLIVTVLTAWRIKRSCSPAECDHAFGLCVIAMLLVSPITWDHYFLLLILPLAVMWKTLPAAIVNRAFLVASIILLGTLYPKWIWDATIPGDGELAVGEAVTASVGTAFDSLTVLSYQFYTLLALFAFAWSVRVRLSPAVARASAPARRVKDCGVAHGTT